METVIANPVPTSPHQESESQFKEREILLINEIENMFKRENLQNNAYLIYRMNNNLETPFAVIFNEYKIKSITTDYAFFLNALKKVKNLEVDSKKELVVPIIPTQKNKIIISNIENGEEEDLKKFLSTGVTNEECEFLFDRKNCCRVIFKDEARTSEFFTWISDKSFKERKLYAYYEPENLYITFLQNVQEKRHTQYAHQDYSSTTSGSYPYYPSYPPNMYPSPYYYPPYGYDPSVMMPPNFPYFFIRKAQESDESNEHHESYHYEDYRGNRQHYEKKRNYYDRDYDDNKKYNKYNKYNEHEESKYYDNDYDDKYYKDKHYKNNKEDYKKDSYKSYKNEKYHKTGKKVYYEPKEAKINQEEFPPISKKEEKVIEAIIVKPEEEEKIAEKTIETINEQSDFKYKKKEIVEIFKNLKKNKLIVINQNLANTTCEEISQLLEREGDIRLEILDPKQIKITSTSTTPLMTGLSKPTPPIILEEKNP